MTDLATMASNKALTTNNSITSSSSVVLQQASSPVHSTSSLVSPDSSATNPISLISSPDVSFIGETPQNTPQTSCPQTPITIESDQAKDISAIENNIGDGKKKVSTPLPTNITINLLTNFERAPDVTDSKMTGSVLAKATLFEQLEKKQLKEQTQLMSVTNRISSTSNSSTRECRKDDIYKSMSALENPGKFI